MHKENSRCKIDHLKLASTEASCKFANREMRVSSPRALSADTCLTKRHISWGVRRKLQTET